MADTGQQPTWFQAPGQPGVVGKDRIAVLTSHSGVEHEGWRQSTPLQRGKVVATAAACLDQGGLGSTHPVGGTGQQEGPTVFQFQTLLVELEP